METATFLRTLKSIRTRYTKNPNEEKMKAALDSIIAKMGGDVLAIVAIGDDADLRQWFLIAAHVSKEDRDEVLPSTSLPSPFGTNRRRSLT